ncbi:metal ABC transporter ATP-binding protein [Halomonas nitroreducens]|uniref:Metal ABC transporter ATP-binding protein n=1 Tax=Halomonas nitroreducens TaxID=447425 RepID=A0A3S0JY66_9GAMM|nr:metal ABC transporter ATP-binding protein [Halomonas nitroreducens]RTR05940.1 metal ABC transporter ATP-binding protein [Halomonas nitroreducens]
MPLLTLHDIGVTRRSNTILEAITLSLTAGEIVTVVGPNGSGKTTLLRVIIGALTPTHGEIRRRPGMTIGYVPQRLHIDPTLPMTVARFMALPRRRHIDALHRALEQAGAAGQIDRQMATLSGGQFQRVLLARALLGQPDLLILDEASQGLDHRATAAFYRQIDRVRRELGCSVLMVSHELHVVMQASDRVICLNGHICCQGRPETVASSPAYRDLLGGDERDAVAFYRHDHALAVASP